MRTVTRFVLIVTLLGAPAGAATADDSVPPLDALLREIPFATFTWSATEGLSDRGAIRLPVSVDGREGWFQLDTGLDVSLLYGDWWSGRGWDTHEGMVRIPDFRIGGMDLGSTWMHTDTDRGTGGDRLGSLGLDALVGAWTVIDYPRRRLAVLKPGDAPRWLRERTTWTPAILRDGKFFPYVSVAGEGSTDLLFDTGSSAFDIIVDRADWLDLADTTAAPDELSVNSWGTAVTVVGAPARGALVVGSARIEIPRVYYLKERPDLFATWPFPARGLIGNAPFFESVVVLDLGLRPRFGIVR